MKRFLLTSLLFLAAPATASAAAYAPSLSIDTAFAPLSGIAKDDVDATSAEIPAEVVVVGDRTYTIGSTSSGEGGVLVIARRSDGTLDTGFSGDGKTIVPIPGTETEQVSAAAALPDGRLRIAASGDKIAGSGGSDRDAAVVGLLPDGSPDPGFGSGGIAMIAISASDDEVRGLDVDGQGRVAVTGFTTATNVRDTWVSLRNPDGSPAAFGTGGVLIIPRGPNNLPDEGSDVVFKPGGGLAVLISVQTNPIGAETDEIAVLRGLNDDGTDDPGFGVGGETVLAVGSPDTSAVGLMSYGGRLWMTGKTMSGVQQMAFLARTEANGNGLQSRQFEMRGKPSGTESIRSSGTDLVVLPGPPTTLVVVGSSVAASSGFGAFAATAISGFEGDLGAAPIGSYVDAGSNQVGLLSVAAASARAVVATGLLFDTNNNFDQSAATMRLLLDADKKCDLAIDVPSPLELTFVGRQGTAAQISVENKGERPCGGTVTVNAPYTLGRAVDTGTIEPGAKFVASGVPVTSGKIRLDDDVARFTVSAPGDSDASNDVRGVRAVYSFCDLALRAVEKPATIPNEGGRRVEVGLRNAGTRTCRSVRLKVSDGSGEGVSKPYSIDRGRSVSDDVLVSAKSNAKIGKKATVRVTTSSSDDDMVATNDAFRLTARVVGVGDSRVSAASATRISGSASGGRGTKADAKGLRVSRVEIAVRKLGSGCRWLSGKRAKFTNRKLAKGVACTPSGWQSASGRGSWKLSMRALPAGRYEVYSRVVTANGFREGRFSRSDGNRRTFRVR